MNIKPNLITLQG